MGGAVLYVITRLFWFPRTVNIAFLVCLGVLVTPGGRRRAAAWILSALLSLSVLPLLVGILATGLDRAGGYTPVSVAVIALLCLVTAGVTVRRRRRAGRLRPEVQQPTGVT